MKNEMCSVNGILKCWQTIQNTSGFVSSVRSSCGNQVGEAKIKENDNGSQSISRQNKIQSKWVYLILP